MNVWGKSQKRESNDERGKSQSRLKSKGGKKNYSNVTCYHCKKIGHIRRLYYERTNAKPDWTQADATIVDMSNDSVEVMTISSS